MISLYCWNAAQKAGMLLSPDLLRTHGERLRTSADVYWIDLEAPTPEEEALVLEEFYPVHRLTREDITQRHHKSPGRHAQIPKAEAFPDYLFVIVNPLSRSFLETIAHADAESGDEVQRPVAQLSAVLTRTLLITHHAEPAEPIVQLRQFLKKHEEQAGRGPDYLFHLILDAMVDQFSPALDHIQDALEGIEDMVFTRPSAVMLHQLLALKRRITLLRKTLVYEREMLARLVRGDFDLIDDREIAYYRNVYDHVVRFNELIETSREMAGDLMQSHLAATSNRMNEIMKVLAMTSTALLPMTLIAGIYGMNFEVLPEKDWEFGYPFALGLMLLTGIIAALYFRWRQWI